MIGNDAKLQENSNMTVLIYIRWKFSFLLQLLQFTKLLIALRVSGTCDQNIAAHSYAQNFP